MEITVITQPDRIFDSSFKILLIYPSAAIKNLLSEYLKQIDQDVVIYLYEEADGEHNQDWLLSCIDQSDVVFFDMDHADAEVRTISGYIISQSNTYWLTNAQNLFYNSISRKRLYSYDQLLDKIGGYIGP